MKTRAAFSRPYGTLIRRSPPIPAISRWAIVVSSLRDDDRTTLATFSKGEGGRLCAVLLAVDYGHVEQLSSPANALSTQSRSNISTVPFLSPSPAIRVLLSQDPSTHRLSVHSSPSSH